MSDSKTEKSRAGLVALVGPTNAGKSTFLNAALGEKVSIVSRKQQSTRNTVRGILTRKNTQMVFLDTPGFVGRERRGELYSFKRRVLDQALLEADHTLLFLDVAKMLSSDTAVSQLSKSLGERRPVRPVQGGESSSALSVVLNKRDLVSSEQVLPLIARLKDCDFTDDRTEFFPVSALKNKGLEPLLEHLSKQMPLSEHFFAAETLSDQPERFFIAEVIREKLYDRVHDELPYSLAVILERVQESEQLLRIDAKILVERDSQKGIVIGKGGAVLKQIGTAARLQLEKILRVKIHLALQVKVEKDWTKSRKGMTKAGYSADQYGAA